VTARRILLVPQAHGNVESYFHFLLGYLAPSVVWMDRTDHPSVTMRECGALDAWLDLVCAHADVRLVSPGVMLRRVVGRLQPMSVLRPLDNPMLFDPRAFEVFARRTRQWAGVEPPGAPRGVLVIERREPAPVGTDAVGRVRPTGAQRRSVPNLAEVASALEDVGPVRVVDPAQMSPAEQIEAFSQAEVVVGQHGAGLANMVWTSPGARVVEIQPAIGESVRGLFSELASSMGRGYAVVRQEDLHAPVAVSDVVAAARDTTPPRAHSPAQLALRRMRRAGKAAELHAVRWPAVGAVVRSVRPPRGSV
jgi:hypothetical protein